MKQNEQIMENLLVDRYMKLIEPLSFKLKIELVSKIFENLKININEPELNKEKLLEELYGSWKDVDDSITEDILKYRTSSDREINLD